MTAFIDRLRNIIKGRRVREYGIATGVLLAVIIVVSFITPYRAPAGYSFYESSSTKTQTATYRATVLNVNADGFEAKVLDGTAKDRTVDIAFDANGAMQSVNTGSTVLLQRDASDTLVFYDTYRIPILIVLVTLFILTVLLTSRKRGLMSLAGLAAGLVIIFGVTIPLLVSGVHSFTVTVGSAFLIAGVSVLLAHGLRKQTYVSLFCIFIILAAVTIASGLAVYLLGLSGLVDDASYSLKVTHESIDLAGVLAGGIVIATLGALDDVVTTQVATVVEIARANPKLTRPEVFKKALSVGSEHIAALVNTLALVYVGAGLPLVVTYTLYSDNIPSLINGAFIATELTRTLIISIGLVLAVPLSTWIAAKYVFHKK